MGAPHDLRKQPPAMAKLVDCKACGQQVSKTALLCPHCGQIIPSPHIRRAAKIVACVLAAVLLVLGIAKTIEQRVEKQRRAEYYRIMTDTHE